MPKVRDLQRMQTRIPKAGRLLCRVREELGLTLRDVNVRSRAIARQRDNPDYEVSTTALSDIENKGKVPHVYRLASLAQIYGRPLDQMLGLYKVQDSSKSGRK